VSALHDVSELVPLVLVGVEQLSLDLRLLDVLPRACDHDECFPEGTTRMAVSRELHLFLGFVLVPTSLWVLHYLVHLKH
jgi:hypothetical protein